ncbi:MAG: MBL fold metallo-hydrolase, partial [Bacteroidales bacterium]|nr:MBL fold metallo-hydrolase [Bacteroidales bacterium]
MKLTILGSSSAGNCYILHNETEALIIEAGIKFDFVKRELDYNLTKVRACLISHGHGDHASQAADFIDSCIPTYASKGTIDSIGIESSFMHRCE